MNNSLDKRSVYHISPVRMWTVPIIFLAFAVFLFTLAGPEKTRMVVIVIGLLSLAFAVVMYFIMRRTRLVLSADGVKLHQFGYVLEADWNNLACLSSERGAEGLVLHEPMASFGARTFAGSRHIQAQPGVSFFSDEQMQLIAQHRFIPIGAFAYRLERGLRSDLIRRSPSLKDCSEQS